jgi:hypothetical protein
MAESGPIWDRPSATRNRSLFSHDLCSHRLKQIPWPAKRPHPVRSSRSSGGADPSRSRSLCRSSPVIPTRRLLVDRDI